MKTATKLCVALVALVVATSSLRAATTVTVDPAIPINDIWVMGDFSGYFSTPPYPSQGTLDYNGLNSFSTLVALTYTNGVLRAETLGVANCAVFTFQDAGWSPQWLSNPTWATILEARLRVLSGPTTGWSLNVGNTAAPGYWQTWGSNYIQTVDLGITDNNWHVVQFDMTSDLGGTALLDWYLALGPGIGTVVEFDYVRLGKISPDTDGDGLPDLIETGTFNFANRRDTGSYTNNVDSDGDGFNDGLEVSLGTNPCDLNDTPPPGIPNGWNVPAALYIVSVPIATNSPVAPIVGIPTSFAISPALPGGLSMTATNGQVYGTPTTPSANTNYTIITTFVGGKTSTNTISIEVRNPFVSYGDSAKTFGTNTANPWQPYTPLPPTVHGPAPTNYSISPTLPAGMSLDPVTGVISGPPTLYKVMTEYTVTCKYAAFPDSSATKRIAALEDPQVRIDPVNTLETYDNWQTMGEFNVTNDWDPFDVINMTRTINDDGYLYLDQNVGQIVAGAIWYPQYAQTNDHRVLEMRVKTLAPGGKSVWLPTYEEGYQAGFNSIFLSIPWDDARNDGQFHVYQMDLNRASNYRFTMWYIYFAFFTAPEVSLQVDYIRLGTLAPRSLQAELQLDGQVKVSWPASGNVTLECTSTLPGGWATATNTVTTDGLRTWILEQPAGPKFYRLIQNGL